METSKNEYRKEEDFALWQLHEIRYQMAKKSINIKELRNSVEKTIVKYNLNNLKFLEKANF